MRYVGLPHLHVVIHEAIEASSLDKHGDIRSL